MPISRSMDKASGRLTIILTSELNLQDIEDLIDGVLADPDFAHISTALVDQRKLIRHSDRHQVMAIVAHLERHKKRFIPLRIAALVGDMDVQYGMMRMLEAYLQAAGMNMETFRDEQEALRWLQQADVAEGDGSQGTSD